MTTLYLDRPDLELRVDGKVLTFHVRDMRTGMIPLKFIERVVIRGRQTRLDSGVLLKLADAGASILFVSSRSATSVATVLGPRHNDVAVRLAQASATLDPAYCARFAVEIVLAKLRRQRRLIERFMEERPDVRKNLFDARQSVERAIGALLALNEPECAQIRGTEGAAARAFYQAYAAVLPPAAGFRGRNRRPPRDPANACLSLAYTLLHFEAVRAAHCAGLDPLLGFYHRPVFGRESLACDLIEPLRPMVDAWVHGLWRQRLLDGTHFDLADGVCLMHKAGREVFYPRWEEHAGPARRWLRRSCAMLARGLRTKGEPLVAAAEDDEP